MKQVRAVRTRRLILQAAAEQFDLRGYAGTPLNCVTRAAGISMGALTFHFPTKQELADAVQLSGIEITRDVVKSAADLPVSPLHGARALALSITRLLDECTTVRATARLTRERAGGDGWTGVWLTCLTELLRRAHDEGGLRPRLAPETFAESVQFLIMGIEEYTRCAALGAGGDSTAVRRVARAWDLLLYGALDSAEQAGPDLTK
ncbi:TetR family transcriptional regulator [Streptomyces sp.]|uniref:TetR family transcriptional regulator n=1 Tax=Streptomyces sp. TaxID=1931 RepID=UPI002D41C164|nr:TetR family transcriptional regulator [Streptomyces sp.]HZF92299.1 TetR family transcriptional regulator [Streptomyces sp.]